MVGQIPAFNEDYSKMKASYLKAFRSKWDSEDKLVKDSVKIISATGIINSYRTQSKIINMADLLQVIEHRDELSENNTAILKSLADAMHCPSARSIVEQYEKLSFGSLLDKNTCHTCLTKWEPPTMTPLEIKEKKSTATNPSAAENLEAAIELIIPKLGRKWRDLSRCLGLTEYDIETIDEEKRLLSEKIHASFKMWKEMKSDSATKEELIRALLKTRRKDLADTILREI